MYFQPIVYLQRSGHLGFTSKVSRRKKKKLGLENVKVEEIKGKKGRREERRGKMKRRLERKWWRRQRRRKGRRKRMRVNEKDGTAEEENI